MTDTTLPTKLGIKPGHKLLVFNPPEDYLARLAPLPADVTVQTAGAGPFDCVQAFVHKRSEVEILAPLAVRAVAPGGTLWLVYPTRSPKGATDLTRNAGWDKLVAAGYEGAGEVAIDETWSALEFRKREGREGGGAVAATSATTPRAKARARR